VSRATVEVAIIDTTTVLDNIPAKACMDPIYPGCERIGGPSYSFLITHYPTNSRLLFDLGLRKDWTTKSSPHLIEFVKLYGIEATAEKNVADILYASGIKLESINTIIWSHHHWDHTGDPGSFPSTTNLIVGPGFKNKYMPGWPADPDTAETTSDCFANREVKEVDFSESATGVSLIGDFRAFDYFGDGAFYILDTPGHTTGHVSALARTTSGDSEDDSTFIFMGGDISHHCALFRPTEHLPLPKEITPNPYSAPFTLAQISCPGEVFASIHYLRRGSDGIDHSYTRPFCNAVGGEFPEECQRSIDKLAAFDGLENVWTIFAHDPSLLGIADFFPKRANDWKQKGWGRETHWRFLTSFVPPENYEAMKRIE